MTAGPMTRAIQSLRQAAEAHAGGEVTDRVLLEHFAARGDLVEVDDPVAGAVRQQAPFPRFAGETPPAPSGAPRLGAHTREVLAGAMGMSDDELDGLAADGVI